MPYKKEGNKNYQIQRLWGRHKQMLRMISLGLYTVQEIADELGVEHHTVSKVINSELGKEMLAMLAGAADSETMDLMVRIRTLAPVALAVQEDLLLDEGSSGDLKNKIADKMLDRAGYAPVTKNLNVNVSAGLKKEDLDIIKRRAKEIKEMSREEDE